MINALYKTTNLKNNRIYIGVHSTEDVGFGTGTDTWEDPYVGSGIAIEQSLSKHGRENFLVEIIAYFDDKKDAYLAEADIVTVEWMKRLGKRTYNRTPGGGEPPSTKNTIWITNGLKDKRIDANTQIEEGWELGRSTMELTEEELERRKQFCLDRNLANNPMNDTQVVMKMSQTKIQGYANGSFVPHNKGVSGHYYWINNGLNSKLILVNETIPIGWTKGRISKNKGMKYKKRKVNAITNRG